MTGKSPAAEKIARKWWLGGLAFLAALIVATSVTAQAAGPQGAARAPAMRRCNIQADRLYTDDQQVQTRWLTYAACMVAAGFEP
jgi:hypothetical protein